MKENNNIELENFQSKDIDSIIKENKPQTIPSSTAEIQNIFKKIRKKNKETEIRKSSGEFGNDETKEDSNSLLNSNDQNKSSTQNIDPNTFIIIALNILAFLLFYLSFKPLSDYFFPIIFFIFPMDLLSFIFCVLSGGITAGIICLVILQKINGNHLLYMAIYYIFSFFFHHYKFIGKSHFDQSMGVFYVYTSILIHFICIFFIFYFILKQCYYEGKINKNNKLIKSFVSRWHSTEKIRRSQKEFVLLNDINKNFILSDKKRNKIVYYLILLSFLSIQVAHIIFMKYKKAEIFSCDNWDLGVNGTRIEDGNCKVKRPEGYCYMSYFKGYFDLNKEHNLNCSIRNPYNEKKNFLKNIENNNNKVNLYTSKIFAFPHTNYDEKYSLKNQKSINDFGKLVNSDIYDYEKNKNIEPKPEAILDFSEDNIYNGKYAELKIELNFNKTLSEQRKKLENDNSLYNNVFMIYVDATSRAHFQRELPKVSNFVKNFMKYDEKSEMNINSYQFMKYHSFAAKTPYNILPMFYGYSIQSNKGINHIKFFQQNGYITGHVVDMCNKEQYDIDHNENIVDEREYIEWDHENVAYLCDGNYFEIKDPYPSDRGAFSLRERCMYGHPTSYYMINYAKEFWKKYSDNKKYFRMAFNYGHEKTGNVISYLDEPLYNFLFEFYDKGYFENTALFIVSDHGNQNHGIYSYTSAEFNVEKKYGVFFLLLSKNKKMINYKQNVLKNQQILVTPYDIHDTLIHIVYGDNNDDSMQKVYSQNNKGKSVLLTLDSNERICKKYDDWITDDFCCCYEK